MKPHSITVSRSFSILLAVSFAVAAGCSKPKSADEKKSAVTATIVSNKLAAIAAAGEPTSPAELNKWYVEPPAGENAAEIYAQAFAALTADDPKSPASVAKNQQALALLQQAAERKSCRYPIDLSLGLGTPIPHLYKFKPCANLLSSAATLEAAAARTANATKDILTGIYLARSLDNEPLLISRLVEIASLAITLQGLEQALTRRAFSAEQLSNIENALHDAEGVTSFQRVLAAERANVVTSFRLSAEDWAKLSSLLVEISILTTNDAAFDFTAYKMTAVYQEDFASALDWMTALVERAAKPFPDALEAGDAPKLENAAGQKLAVSAMFLPGFGNSLTRAAEIAARLRTAQTALAVERFRLQHASKLPASLNELSPVFITSVPNDPYDGQPLRFKKLPTRGYVVYSVGKNRNDDGGTAHAKDKPSSAPDVTFTVGR